jgi:Mg-chelatase subunit ChlI
MKHHIRRAILLFTAIVGQDTMKNALILNALNPRIDDAEKRIEIVKQVESFERDQEEFKERFTGKQKELQDNIAHAKQIVNEVAISDNLLKITAETC